MKQPNFQALEQHFGCDFPKEIKDLYRNPNEILKSDFKLVAKQKDKKNQAWYIAFYQPADLENVRDAWPDTTKVFEFANDGCGNGYTIDPKLENPPVMFHDHETGEWDKVADSFSEFITLVEQQSKN